jgi:hypothetical protein
MKTYRDTIAATLSLGLAVMATAAVFTTDLYAQAASAEVRGIDALLKTGEPERRDSTVTASPLLAVNEVRS